MSGHIDPLHDDVHIYVPGHGDVLVSGTGATGSNSTVIDTSNTSAWAAQILAWSSLGNVGTWSGNCVPASSNVAHSGNAYIDWWSYWNTHPATSNLAPYVNSVIPVDTPPYLIPPGIQAAVQLTSIADVYGLPTLSNSSVLALVDNDISSYWMPAGIAPGYAVQMNFKGTYLVSGFTLYAAGDGLHDPVGVDVYLDNSLQEKVGSYQLSAGYPAVRFNFPQSHVTDGLYFNFVGKNDGVWISELTVWGQQQS